MARRQRRLARLTAEVAMACGLALTFAPSAAHAQTWIGGTSLWNTNTNWSPATVPNSSGATATFGLSSTTTVNISGNIQVGAITFTSAATSPYNISLNPGFDLSLSGVGITNNSSSTESIAADTNASGSSAAIAFNGSASAGSNVTITNFGSQNFNGSGAQTEFNNTSSAGSATIINDAGTVNGATGGSTLFWVPTGSGSNPTAGSAQITNNGATVAGAYGGTTSFDGGGSAGNATITTLGGTNGGYGGYTSFFVTADGGTARAITNGNGTFDISGLSDGGMKIGSIEGSGIYDLGAKTLTVGGNNLSTTVSGAIADGGLDGGTGGSLVKTGTGTLILSGANTYTGSTTVTGGILEINATDLSGSINSKSVSVGTGGTFEILTSDSAFSTTLSNNISNGLGGVGTILVNSAAAVTLSGALTDGAVGTLGVTQSGSGATRMTGNNNYSGPTNVTVGTLFLGGGSLASVASLNVNSVISVSGTGSFAVANVSGNVFANNVTNGVGGLGTFDVDYSPSGSVTISSVLTDGAAGQLGFTVSQGVAIVTSMGSTNTGGTNILGSSSVLQIGTASTPGAIGPGVVSLNGNARLLLTNVNGGVFANNIVDTDTGAYSVVEVNSSKTLTMSGVMSDGNKRTLQFSLEGSGTTILTGANTYTGPTNVDGGTLVVTGSLGGTSLEIFGGTLSGTGTITGSVDVGLGTLAPGGLTTPGTLTVGNLEVDSDGVLALRLGAPTGTNDLVKVTGNLSLGGGVTITPQAGFTVGTYTIITYSGNLLSGVLGASPLPGFTETIVTSVPHEVQLVVSYPGGAQYWDGSGAANDNIVAGGSGNWNVLSTNWTNVGGTVNSQWQGGTAIFGGTAGTVNLATPINVQGIIFNTNGYTIAGTQFLSLSGNSAPIIVSNAGTSATISAPLTGNLVVGGAGTLVLTNSSFSPDSVTVQSGNLQIGTSSAAGNSDANVTLEEGSTLTLVNLGSNIFTGGIFTYDAGNTVKLAPSSTLTIDAIFSGTVSVPVVQSTAGTTIMANGSLPYTATTTVSAGTLQVGNATTTGNLGNSIPVTVTGGGKLTLVNLDSSENPFTDTISNGVSGVGSVIINSTQFITLTGVISDGAAGQISLTQAGSGTTVIPVGTADAYTGATNINAGVLEVDGSLGATTVNVGSGGKLTGTGVIGGNVTLTGNGVIDLESGAVIDGTLGITGGHWNDLGTADGVVTASSGSFGIGGGANLIALQGLNVTGGSISGTGTLTGNLTYTSSTSSTFAGAIIGAVTLNNAAATLTLTGNDTGVTLVTVQAGTLQFGTGTTLASLSAGTMVSIQGGALATNLANNGIFAPDVTLSNGAAFSTLQTGTNTVSGVISGNGHFNQNGTGTTILNNTDSYTGATTVSKGTLQVGDGTNGSLTGTSGVTVAAGAMLVLDLPDGTNFSPNITLNGTGTLKAIEPAVGTQTLSGFISGTGSFTQSGAGTTILPQSVMEGYTGATSITAGTLEVDGELAAGSTVAVTTAGTLTGGGTINGKATLTGNGTINLSSGTIGGTLAVTGGNWSGTGTVDGVVTSSSGSFNLGGTLI
ncbi:MAG TPA: autotransporter-associated beta strand repeat-containing protein, partial [Chthoniobacter sp.]